MNIVDARLAYILNKLEILEQKIDRIDGTLTGLSIKVYEDKNDGTFGVLGHRAAENNNRGRTRKARTSKKDI